MKIRRLNSNGLERFGSFLDAASTSDPVPVPEHILTDPALTDEVFPETNVDKRNFATRLEAAEYLNQRFEIAGLKGVEQNGGLWAWLSLFYFDELCPQGTDGKRRLGERARVIPELSDFRRYYRHLLAGPYLIFRAHRDEPKRALALLCGPLYKPGEIVGQLAAYQEIVTNASIMTVATRLYVSETTGRPKRGSSAKIGGSARRLVNVLNQFDVTWDLYSIPAAGILSLLPTEFARFKEN